MGMKRAVFDSVFWIGFVLVVVAFFVNSLRVGWVGVIVQLLGLLGMIVFGIKGSLPDRLPDAKGLPLTSVQRLQEKIVVANNKVNVAEKPKVSFFARWFQKKPVSSNILVKQPVPVVTNKQVRSFVVPKQFPVISHASVPVAKTSFFARWLHKKSVIPSLQDSNNKKRLLIEHPKIPRKSSVDRSRMTFFMIIILALLMVIIFQVTSFGDKPLWFYGLFTINVIFLMILFGSSKKVLKKSKSDIESQAEHLALQEEKLQADKDGKQLSNEKKFELLKHHVRQALAGHFSKNTIVKSALQAGWPENEVVDAYNVEVTAPRGVESLIRSYEMSILKTHVKKAIDGGFAEDAVVESALQAGWPEALVHDSYDSITSKKMVLARPEDEELPEEREEQVLRVTAKLIKHETDLDRVYELIKDKKSVKMSDIASQFNISKKQAEEWAAILEKQGLIEMFYPILGEPELRWKSLKVIE